MQIVPINGNAQGRVMQTIDTIPLRSQRIAPRRKTGGMLHNVANWLFWRVEIRRSRKELLLLNDSQLRDIGVTREEAGLEGSLPWWR
ncbi:MULTISPECIES: DUF1127 domain-containing protein [Mesorhizobium]|nr:MULTISPECIES: DUF1127 domain-containing protein [Mesorhizobium]